MGKEGYWNYWFKSPDGFDIQFAKNKKNIPHGYKYVMSMHVYNHDGTEDEEIMDENKKVIWFRKNIHKLTECEIVQMSYDMQNAIHKALNITYPKKYKKIFEKKIKGFKGCKIK